MWTEVGLEGDDEKVALDIREETPAFWYELRQLVRDGFVVKVWKAKVVEVKEVKE